MQIRMNVIVYIVYLAAISSVLICICRTRNHLLSKLTSGMKDKIQEDHYSAGGTLKSEEDAPCIVFYCLTFSEAEAARIPPLVERNAGVRISSH